MYMTSGKMEEVSFRDALTYVGKRADRSPADKSQKYNTIFNENLLSKN